jgi:hypothetical protein
MSETLTKSETAKARKKGWLPVLAGVRLSSFHGDVSEDVASNVHNGSGFSNRTAGITDSNRALISPYQGDYLPAHTTFDVSTGKASVSPCDCP